MSASPVAMPVKGISLIELLIAMVIVGIIAACIIPSYSTYRMRAQRLNAQFCLLNLAQRQESYFVRHNHYLTDLRVFGYKESSSAVCAETDQYRITVSSMDSAGCPLSRCYQLSAIPQGTQMADGPLYLTYDGSQSDISQRSKKERGQPGSGQYWN